MNEEEKDALMLAAILAAIAFIVFGVFYLNPAASLTVPVLGYTITISSLISYSQIGMGAVILVLVLGALGLIINVTELIAIGVTIFGGLEALGIISLLPPAAQPTWTSYPPPNFNMTLGIIYVAFGAIIFFLSMSGEEQEEGISQRWFMFILGILPVIMYFLELDLTQGGPFGTFKVGGITLEHEGFGVGFIISCTFFERHDDILWWIFLIGGIACIIDEYFINHLVDFSTNPFGCFFSGLLGFLFSFGFQKIWGAEERENIEF
jgi:hypothetical protein